MIFVILSKFYRKFTWVVHIFMMNGLTVCVNMWAVLVILVDGETVHDRITHPLQKDSGVNVLHVHPSDSLAITQ